MYGGGGGGDCDGSDTIVACCIRIAPVIFPTANEKSTLKILAQAIKERGSYSRKRESECVHRTIVAFMRISRLYAVSPSSYKHILGEIIMEEF